MIPKELELTNRELDRLTKIVCVIYTDMHQTGGSVSCISFIIMVIISGIMEKGRLIRDG